MIKNTVAYLVKPYKFINKSQELQDNLPLNYIRVEYLYCGICGGDYSRYLGYRLDYPISLGHEFVAKVIDMNCDKALNFTIGDYVVSDFNYRCHDCFYCNHQKTHLCVQNGAEKFTNRAFALYGDIHYSYLVKTNIPSKYIYRATMVEPLSCILHALDFYDLSKLEHILIYGTGNIGMLCAFYLSKCKNKKVFLYDINMNKEMLISELFMCKHADFSRTYDLIIEATNEPTGFLECITKVGYNPNICSFSHLYGQNTNEIYDLLVKCEASIYFPLRNGSQNTLHKATQNIESNWVQGYDKLLKIYQTNNVNLPFEDKCNCIEPKQIINFLIDK